MNYENQICPVCGKPLAKGEDIVVCPVCATPQHRECWMKNGRCANEDLHASGYVWQRSEGNFGQTSAPEESNDSKICPSCGSENPPDALHCGNCGMLFGSADGVDSDGKKRCAYCGKENDGDAIHCKYCGAPFGAQATFFDAAPYMNGSGISPDEKIGENTASDLAIFVQASARRYLPKFKRFAKGKKLSFNFAAFFFAPYWYFFRKLYKAGAFFMVLFATASLMLSGLTGQILDEANAFMKEAYSFDYSTATEEEAEAFERQLLQKNEESLLRIRKPALIVIGVNTLLRLICALTADRFYYKKVVADSKIINDNIREENTRKLALARRGGLSVLAFAASLIGYNALISLLVSAASMISF